MPAHINRKIVEITEEGHGKWLMELECGHKYLCDHSCQQPGGVTSCSQCEELENEREQELDKPSEELGK